MSNRKKYFSLSGTVLSPVSDEQCDVLPNVQLTFEKKKSTSKILSHQSNFLAGIPSSDIEVVEAEKGHEWVILPGFVDLHFHWVQDAVRLMPKASLLTWLKKYTWPYESKFKDPTFSKEQAKLFSRELLRFGTIAGACYSSLHPHTVSHALESFRGDFFVGNALMTEESPEYLTHTEREAMNSMKSLSKKWGKKYVVTPRFAPTVSGDFLRKIGDFRKEHRHFMQTHLSETLEECEFVLSLYKKFNSFKNAGSYTELYKRAGLLSSKSIFGHAIHLSDEEWKMLARSKSVIAHCPTSNAPVSDQGLGSGLFDFKRADKEGVRWGLGSDIGGGPFLSMLDVMESFVEQNKRAGVKGATATRAFYRATQASADILGLGRRIGSLDVGKEASLILFKRKKTLTPLKSSEHFFKEIFRRARGERRGVGLAVEGMFLRGNKIDFLG